MFIVKIDYPRKKHKHEFSPLGTHVPFKIPKLLKILLPIFPLRLIGGANGLHMGEQVCEPGTGAPYHWHYYEEFITVMDGVAEVKVNGETAIVEARGTLIVPPRAFHGFTNVGDGLLTVVGVTDWPIMDTGYVEDEDGIVVRGWEPGIETRRRLIEEGDAR